MFLRISLGGLVAGADSRNGGSNSDRAVGAAVLDTGDWEPAARPGRLLTASRNSGLFLPVPVATQ